MQSKQSSIGAKVQINMRKCQACDYYIADWLTICPDCEKDNERRLQENLHGCQEEAQGELEEDVCLLP